MKRTVLLFASILVINTINAQDRHFLRTYESTNLAKGIRDVEVWSTVRMGKEAFFRRIDERLEFEVGLTDRLQTALYLNASHISAADKNDTLGIINSESEFSISSEWKLKLSDASTNFIGSGLYAEVTISGTEFEVETKILLDKRINNHLIAFNIVSELEWAQEIETEVIDGKIEQDSKMALEATPLEFDLAYMYHIKPNFGIGIEAIDHYEITPSGGLEHSALLAGPSLFWNPKDSKHSILINFLPQIMNMYKTAAQPNALDLDEYEKYNFRILLDFSF